MVQYRPFGLSDSEPVDQLPLASAGQTVSEQRGALSPLLDCGGKSGQQPDGSEIAQLGRQPVQNLWLGCLAPGEQDLVRRGRGAPELTHCLGGAFNVRPQRDGSLGGVSFAQ